MNCLQLPDHRRIALDKDGYLCALQDWDEDVAQGLARAASIELSAAHWEVIHLLRQFYELHGLSPAMRALVKYTGQKLGSDKGHSVYLLQLFPGNPALLGAKIAGLPRPVNCF